MILIADGGSTKTFWSLLHKDPSDGFYTEGYNPYFVDGRYIVKSLKNSLPVHLITDSISEVKFYGAGVHNVEKSNILRIAFKEVFPNATVEIEHDLLSAARSLLGSTKGFAAILGTGTNSCLYDGSNITYQINSGAYILGDEGSGCYMGKQLLIDYLRNYIPAGLSREFVDVYKLSPHEIEENVYTRPLANLFCAGFSKFLYDHIENEYCYNVVHNSFTLFFENIVSHYPDFEKYELNVVGSVGYSFKNILETVSKKFGMEIGKIEQSPMLGLLKYHQ